jgi:hypothetical protein
MRVGILTSHRVPCGIAQYSERFANALARIGHEPVILAGRADEHRSVPEEFAGEVHDVAQIGLWRNDGEYNLNWGAVRGLGLDVIHVQYQSMLFDQWALADLVRDFPGPTAVTFHDSCNRPDFPAQAFDLRFTHRDGVGVGAPEVIPFAIEERPPVVRTFGLGRTRSDLIAPICERLGWIFEDIASHEPIQGGGYDNKWRSHEDLIAWLRGADAIVLWYDDQPMAGSSQAARTAMAARRPVIVNDVTWFRDLPTRVSRFVKVGSLEELEAELTETLGDRYVTENSWESVASRLVERYQSVHALAA